MTSTSPRTGPASRTSATDSARSHTAEELLIRFFHEDPEKRWELQLVADEVGMGKTFVALAAAYSVLRPWRRRVTRADFGACAQRILIIAPQMTLANKWAREVGEFVRRCVHERAA